MVGVGKRRIGRPEAFEKTLRTTGPNIKGRKADERLDAQFPAAVAKREQLTPVARTTLTPLACAAATKPAAGGPGR